MFKDIDRDGYGKNLILFKLVLHLVLFMEHTCFIFNDLLWQTFKFKCHKEVIGNEINNLHHLLTCIHVCILFDTNV